MNTADKIVQRLCECGYEVYIVGGAVRDMLLNKEPNDEDIVTNASPEEITAIFKEEKIDLVGANFLVTMVNGIEVATYRKDRNTGPDRHNCDVVKCDTLLEDLHKRDFTINSIATCPYTGDIIDPFNGVEDLNNKIIKFVGNPYKRIYEDYARMIRAARFCALIDGEIEERSIKAIIANNYKIQYVAPERIRLEILKVMGYRKPSIFFDVLYKTGMLSFISPDLNRMYGHTGGEYHDEMLCEHFKMTGDSLLPNDKILRLVGYLHDIGKPIAYDGSGWQNFAKHEVFGSAIVKTLLKNFKFSNKEISRISNLILYHMRSLSNDITDKGIRRLLRKFEEDGVDWDDWLRLKIADKKANLKAPNYTDEQIKQFMDRLINAITYDKKAFNVTDLKINGNQVMEITELPQGKRIGIILNYLLDKVMDDPDLNEFDKLRKLILDNEEEILKYSIDTLIKNSL